MERLHDMLTTYNANIPTDMRTSWSKQFLQPTFPSYWEITYKVLQFIDREKRIIEIGAGQGDVTAIACYLGFNFISAYERNIETANIAEAKISDLFHRISIIEKQDFAKVDLKDECADILIMVNCAYADGCTTKEEYLSRLVSFYNKAGKPKLVILEVIDASYTCEDLDFPVCIRLNPQDVESMFPMSKISSYLTYKYPKNKRTKRLYVIEKR